MIISFVAIFKEKPSLKINNMEILCNLILNIINLLKKIIKIKKIRKFFIFNGKMRSL